MSLVSVLFLPIIQAHPAGSNANMPNRPPLEGHRRTSYYPDVLILLKAAGFFGTLGGGTFFSSRCGSAAVKGDLFGTAGGGGLLAKNGGSYVGAAEEIPVSGDTRETPLGGQL